MEVYYDTEFLDVPPVVSLLSIGMVREDGKDYYAIADDLNAILITGTEFALTTRCQCTVIRHYHLVRILP
jgi:hypothetical protein